MVTQQTQAVFIPAGLNYGKTTISYELYKPIEVSLVIKNILGVELANIIVDEYRDKGQHFIEFEAGKFPAGVYFCTLKAGALTETVKILILK